MTLRLGIAFALTLLLPQVAGAQQPPGGEPDFAGHLFPPELVMQHQRRLGLTAEQRTRITDAIKQLQAQVVDLQWQIQEEQQRLSEVLAAPSVDRAAALSQVERVLDVERRVKLAHIALLITIKNTLTPEQQTMLRELRAGEKGRR